MFRSNEEWNIYSFYSNTNNPGPATLPTLGYALLRVGLCSTGNTAAYQIIYSGMSCSYCRIIIIIGKQEAINMEIDWLEHFNQNSRIPPPRFPTLEHPTLGPK